MVMEALDFAERAQGVKITQEMADAAVRAVNEKMQGSRPGEQQQEPAVQPPAKPRGLISMGA